MYFQRYYLNCLAHASYMIADETTCFFTLPANGLEGQPSNLLSAGVFGNIWSISGRLNFVDARRERGCDLLVLEASVPRRVGMIGAVAVTAVRNFSLGFPTA